MQLAWMAFPFTYADLKSPFAPSRAKKTYFSTYMCPISYTTSVYACCSTIARVHRVWCSKLKIMSGFHSMSQDPWSLTFHTLEILRIDPLVSFEGYKLSHIKASMDSTIQLWEKIHSRETSLHIESASLCPLKFEHIVQPPSSSLFDGEPHCLSYMSLPLVEDWSGGGPTGRDLVSQFRDVPTQKFVIQTLMLIIF